ncbi:MAG TPA: protein kinase, partial [Vicinamibacteria bacterium]
MHAAVASLRRAAELDPLSAEAQRLLGYVLMAAGERAQAREALDQALEIAPFSDWALQFRATCWLLDGKAAEARAPMERSRTEVWRLWGRALANHSLGKEAQSREVLEEVIERWAHVGTYQIAQVFAWRGERDRAFEWLERCFREHDVGLMYLKLDQLLGSLRGDPRWNDLLRRVGLPLDAASQAEPAATPGPADVGPGSFSALLLELARAPERDAGDAWARALRPGLSVGKFELVREIGSGGFGVVWEARDRELGRRVAFKAVRAGARAAIREERLLREAEAAARLTHPNIVTLHDLGRSDHGPYLVLELLRGRTLEERLAQGRLSVQEAVRIGAEVVKGLAHAHGRGVVHRDLKPANVFLCDDGQVKVLDFGLAHAFGQLRQDGGTPAYMAPEQWQGAPEDERTDVFALGVLLFRMLSGELPFPDDGGKAVLGPRKAPALEVPDLPALGDLVGRMLEKSAVARPRQGGDVAEALKSLLQELDRAPAGGAPVTTRPRAGSPRTRRAWLVLVGIGLLAATAGATYRLVLGERGLGREPI